MKIGIVIGTVTATIKNPQLVGMKLLLTNVVDENDTVLEAAIVAVDTCGAGVGDKVLLTTGSAARMPESVAGKPVDNSIVGVVDAITTAKTS